MTQVKPRKRGGVVILAKAAGCSTQNIQYYEKQGIIERGRDGKFDIEKSLQLIRDNVHPGYQPESMQNLGGGENKSRASFNEAKVAKEAFAARMLELDLQEREGVLFRGDKVANIIAQIARSFRDGLFVMARSVSIGVAAESDPARCEQMIVDGICAHIMKITDEFERNIKI